MKSVLKISLAVLGVFVVLGVMGLAAGLTAVYFSDDMVEMRAFEKKFAMVELGDSETKVLAVLGKPDARETVFRLGQERGFEEAYARAMASGSTRYLVWTKGFHVVFSVGIDSQGTVRAKEYGGT